MIEIISLVMALSSGFLPITAQATAAPVNYMAPQAADETIVDNSALSAPDQPQTVEERVREYFADTPILADIAGCESHFRQFGPDGRVVRGEINHGDIGVMQINEYYHADEAKKLGLDLTSLQDNMEFARILYNKEGVAPWQSSSACWQKYENIANK